MTLSKLDAAHLIEDYRMTCWAGAAIPDSDGLKAVLTGAPWDHLTARHGGVSDNHARQALDAHQDRWHRPPTPAELHRALDDATSSPDAVAQIIDNTRQILANAKARRAHDHQQLRAASDARARRTT